MSAIAVLIPCFNEEKTIAKVVRDFIGILPGADIYVYDNNSTDNSVHEASAAGAIVRFEKKQGKGNVIRAMFRDIEADIFVMVDGDDTYPAAKVHELIRPVLSGEADMVIGSRLHSLSDSSFKWLNRIGNKIFIAILNTIFRVRITDLLSGYRVFNRQMVKSLPVLSSGFEIETELTVKGLERGYRVIEVPVNLSPRPDGSESKINIIRDSVLIFYTIFALFRDYKPLTVFGLMGLLFIACGLVPGLVVSREFLATGYISRIPSAILAIGLILSGFLMFFMGVVLHAIAHRFQELDYQMRHFMGRIEQVSSGRNSRREGDDTLRARH